MGVLDILKNLFSSKLISPIPENQLVKNSFKPGSWSIQNPRAVQPVNKTMPVVQPAKAVEQPNKDFYFDFSQYPSSRGFQPTQPPAQLATLIRQNFPNEATPAAAVAWAENKGYRPGAVSLPNANLSRDYGLFQNNSATLADLMKRKPQLIKSLGINSVQDLFDPAKNVRLAKVIKDEGGWGRWFGWQNLGFKNLK